MTQRIKVQDGSIVFESADSSYDMNVNVIGEISLTKQLTLGTSSNDGTIVTPASRNLNIQTGLNGDIVLITTGTGEINLNNLTMSGPLTLSGNPINPLEASTKQYVDAVASGLLIQAPCVTATEDTLAVSTGGSIIYNNGSSGIGATLTTTTSWGTIGGVVVSVGNRVLIKDEVSQLRNGIYTITSSTIMTRATDFDETSEISAGDLVFISNGNLNGTQWVQITPSPIVIGTDSIVFYQLAGPGVYVGTNGIDVTGNTISFLGLPGGISGQIPFQSGVGSTTFDANLTFNSVSGTLSVENVEITSNLIRSVSLGIAAAGSTLGTATPLTSYFNVVTSGAINSGVSLPLTPVGISVYVLNESANDILVYPGNLLSTIDLQSAGTGYLLEAGFRVSFFLASSTQWYTMNVPFTPV